MKPSAHWWDKKKCNDEALSKRIFETVQDIEAEQGDIHDANERHARLYQGYTPPGLGFRNPVRRRDYAKYLVTKNITRSMCDTATSLIAKTRPKATFITDGADWKVQRKAELLDQAMVGAFTKADVWRKFPKMFRDSTIFGTGCIKLVNMKEDGFVDIERVVIDEVVVDEREHCTRDGDPWNIYHVRIIDKEVLKAMFPSKAKAINDIKPTNGSNSGFGKYKVVTESSLVVIEAWHRAAGGGEGRHTITIDGLVLRDEDWKYDWFPFVFFHWCEPISGFYGQGLAEQLCGRQMNINEVYRFIRRAHQLILVPRVFVDASNTLLKTQLDNEIGSIIPTRGGKPPTFYTPQALHSEIYRWLETLEQGGYDEAGISPYSASNQLPAGIESAPAQRELTYKEGARFAPVSQRYEDAFVELAKKMLAFYKEMPKKTKITFANNKFMRKINWGDVDMENDQYEIRIAASSIESLSPASRQQAVIELSQTGWVTEQEGRRLLGHPDLIANDRLNTATIRYAEWVVMQLCDGVAASEVRPEGTIEDVEETARHVRASWMTLKMSKTDGGDAELESVMEQHIVWLDYAKEEIAKAAPPMPGMPSQPVAPPAPMMPNDASLLMQGQ